MNWISLKCYRFCALDPFIKFWPACLLYWTCLPALQEMGVLRRGIHKAQMLCSVHLQLNCSHHIYLLSHLPALQAMARTLQAGAALP